MSMTWNGKTAKRFKDASESGFITMTNIITWTNHIRGVWEACTKSTQKHYSC